MLIMTRTVDTTRSSGRGGRLILLLVAGLWAMLTAGCGFELSFEEPVVPAPVQSLGDAPWAQDTAGLPPHPTDPYFALHHVLHIAIDIAPADWDSLRHQTRTFENLVAEIQTGCLAEPFADIYSWFSAQVTVDGETHADVGIRKKGFVGSQSSDKPSLKLRFDQYTDGQLLGGVMERMTLNNSIQDDSLLNTCLAYQVFADAGLPAPRCNFATVSVNNQELGLYVHVEEIKPPFLERHFANAQGNLYEGTISDFRPAWRGTFEKKTNEEAADWSDIDAVVAALQDPAPAGLTALEVIVDRDRFLSFWATEVLVGHWDGYTSNRNNYHFYREPDGSFVFIPWGVDQVFSLEDDPNPFDSIDDPPPSVWAHGAIAHRLYQNAVGHWDGYTSNRNNYHFYREPDGSFVFIPWGVDQVFSLEDDPNPFDSIDDPPPSVWAHGAIAHRLYQNAAGRTAYTRRLQELLDTVWNEAALLKRTDEMAAIVQQYALPAERAAAAADTERVRRFIAARRDTILQDLEPMPPDWPWPLAAAPFCADGESTGSFAPGKVELHLATTWGSNQSADPFGKGTVTHFLMNDTAPTGMDWTVIAGPATPEEAAGFGMTDAVSLTAMALGMDGSLQGLTLVLPLARLSSGVALSISAGEIGGVLWTIPVGGTVPDRFVPVTGGQLELIEASTVPGAVISARFHGSIGDGTAPSSIDTDTAMSGPPAHAADIGLVINEIAAQGEPRDWFELYNASTTHLALADFVLADDLTDVGKRTAFPTALTIPPGAYLVIALDTDGWPGFALGRDEELGIWTATGILVDAVDWSRGQADTGTSLARVPDGTGEFQTVGNPTPGAPNQ